MPTLASKQVGTAAAPETATVTTGGSSSVIRCPVLGKRKHRSPTRGECHRSNTLAARKPRQSRADRSPLGTRDRLEPRQVGWAELGRHFDTPPDNHPPVALVTGDYLPASELWRGLTPMMDRYANEVTATRLHLPDLGHRGQFAQPDDGPQQSMKSSD
jgi:hypothetical protein